MKNYKVDFYKLVKEQQDKKEVITGKEFLGSVTVDDYLSSGSTLISKAFKRASANCQMADRVEVTEV